MKNKLLAAFVFATSLYSASATAQENPIPEHVPNSSVVGEYDLKVAFWDVYDAKFYAPEGVYAVDKPFALELEYKLDLDGEKIAKHTTKEMKKQGFKDKEKLSEWFNSMAQIIPDVKDDDVIIGIKDQNNHAIFYLNGELIGTVEDPEFTKAFFDIWVSEKTSKPRMRRALLGL